MERIDAIEFLINHSTADLAATTEALQALDVDDDELEELGVLEQLEG
jgi:hypothetical protein